jgi:4-amino-4-deoxy-L-arabinose transferase-like glycosyltransferase
MTGRRRWLIVILLVALVGRVAFLVFFADTLTLKTSGYDDYAVHLMEGRGFTRFDDRAGDSDLPPLYSLFLAGIYTLFGRSPIPVACVQIVADLLTTFLIYLIGRRVGGEGVGLVSAALYGCYPYLLFQNLTVNDTGIFICLLMTAIWLSYRTRDSRNAWYAATVGLTLGVAALTKTWVILVVPLLILAWRRRLGFRESLRFALLSGLCLTAVLSPWVIRNTLLNGQFVFVSTNGGSNLQQGNNPCVADYLAHGWDAQWVDCLAEPPSGMSEVQEDRWRRDQAIRYLRGHPSQWPRLFGIKFLVLWSPAIMPTGLPPHAREAGGAVLLYETPAFQAARTLHLAYFGPLLAFAAIGLFWAWRDRAPVGLLLTVPLIITVFYVAFHPSTRYRSPADPFVFILAAYALNRPWRRLKPRVAEVQRP